MNGILSAHPGQGAVRLLVGAQGLLLTQSLLLLRGNLLAATAWPLVLALTLLALLSTLVAIVGDGSDHDRPWRSRHGR
ncbi:hypothetical protein QLH51_13035 [Sphingomonas sp. 2R-10]|uniref:hypothetical protein n=1 Tax=Sphingomonas sp. 2R-10 TaxID=3045148 RepID=UPI000F76BCBB|nr:hypothetical protein [Sphingomonas sp. 2R-10]MDJ0277723.1 hypothetical protein [Sphingomonas sp. 2R-10]